MKTSSLLFIVLILVLGVSLVSIWFYPSLQDYMEGNAMWNGIKDFSATFDATNLDSLDDLPEMPENQVLIAIPYLDYSDRDLSRIRTFVFNGGTLLLMDDFGYGNTILEFLDIKARFSHALLLDPLFNYKNQTMPKLTDFGTGLKEQGIRVVVFNSGSALSNVSREEGLAWSSEMSFLDLNEDGRPDADELKGPFAVAAEYRLGEGTVDLVADPSVLINAMVSRDDNYSFIKYLAKGGPEKLFIDRSHLSKTPLDVSKIGLKQVRQVLSNPYILLGIIAAIFAITIRHMLVRGEVIG